MQETLTALRNLPNILSGTRPRRLGLVLLLTALALSGVVSPATPVAEAASVSCAPRPRVLVRSEPALIPAWSGNPGQDALLVTVTTTGTGNGVRAIRLTSGSNVLVSIQDATAHAAPYESTFAPGAEPPTVMLALWRPNSTQSSFSRLVVVDACGEWTTFVGRGAGAR